MIEKLTQVEPMSPMESVLLDKVNEITSWINEVSGGTTIVDKQVTVNLPNIDAGELAYLQKENSDLKDEVEKLQKQLNIATNGLNAVHYTIVNNNDLLGTVYRMKNIAGESLDELKGGDNE